MDYIQFDKITKSFGYEKLLDAVSFKVCSNEHIGLIGNNGCGKTTLFKLMLGIEAPDDGLIIKKKGLVIGYLEQETLKYGNDTVLEVLKSAFSKVIADMSELEIITEKLNITEGIEQSRLLTKYGSLQASVENNRGYEIDSLIDIISGGLGIQKSRYESKMQNLSGGERTRVFLAKLLLEEPDVLLLDEPTNHLDLIAVDWLEKYLNNYKRAVISISHDRIFLDNTTNKIIEIEYGKITSYPGNYSWSRIEKEKNDLLHQKQYDAQQKEIKRLEKAAKRLRDWANQSDNPLMYKKAVNIESRIDHLDKVEKPSAEYVSMQLELKNTSKSGKEIIRTENLRKSLGGKLLFESIDFLMRKGEKIVISGENGCGKTTFINILMGGIDADDGYSKIGTGISYGLLPQEIIFEDESKTLLEEMRLALICDGNTARRVLALFGFGKNHVMKRLSELSGGERKRLKLAELMQNRYNLLIMDEPTNHMDIASREIIEEAVLDYDGSCLFISHDRYFIQKVCSRKFLLDERQFKEYSGDYIDVIAHSSNKKVKKASVKNKPKISKHSKNRIRELEEIENKIQILELNLKELNSLMQKTIEYSELNRLLSEKNTLETKLSEFYKEWNSKV